MLSEDSFILSGKRKPSKTHDQKKKTVWIAGPNAKLDGIERRKPAPCNARAWFVIRRRVGGTIQRWVFPGRKRLEEG